MVFFRVLFATMTQPVVGTSRGYFVASALFVNSLSLLMSVELLPGTLQHTELTTCIVNINNCSCKTSAMKIWLPGRWQAPTSVFIKVLSPIYLNSLSDYIFYFANLKIPKKEGRCYFLQISLQCPTTGQTPPLIFRLSLFSVWRNASPVLYTYMHPSHPLFGLPRRGSPFSGTH